MQGRVLLATDLDRTLLPNGSQEYDGSMEKFAGLRDRFVLVFVTGRNLSLIKQAMEEFSIPSPDYAIAEVGTSIFGKDFRKDEAWQRIVGLKTAGWDMQGFKDALERTVGLRLQEDDRQNDFKLSYYVDNPSDSVHVIKDVTW